MTVVTKLVQTYTGGLRQPHARLGFLPICTSVLDATQAWPLEDERSELGIFTWMKVRSILKFIPNDAASDAHPNGIADFRRGTPIFLLAGMALMTLCTTGS